MPGEIFDFEWFVHAEGYDWLEAAAVKEMQSPGGLATDRAGERASSWIVVAGKPTSDNIMARKKYYPLRDCSCLFRIFAETMPDSAGITAFANRYGLLGVELDAAPGRIRPFIGTAEPSSVWESEIIAIRNALNLWDMVSADHRQGLEEYLRPLVELVRIDVDGDGGHREHAMRNLKVAESGEVRWFRTHPGILENFAAGEYEQIALDRVQAIVNEHLGSRVSPRILWDDHQKGDWGLYFVPDSLIGTIWIQFAQAITENRDYRRCRQCDSWFEIDHYKARTNRYFCSNACRSKAYRERQQQARKMAESGLGPEKIAAELGSDLETVSKWIQ